MSTWDADAANVYYRAFDLADLDPTEAGEDYIPAVTTGGTTTPFAGVAVEPTDLAHRLGEAEFGRDLARVISVVLAALLVLSYLTR